MDRVVLYVRGGGGGDGGSVIVRAVAGTDSLAEVVHRKHWRAQGGGPGQPDNCHGRRARDLIIPVPPGTLVLDRDRKNVLRDLTEDGQQVTVAHGGRGGRGNRAFATAINQAPRETQPGTPGEERWMGTKEDRARSPHPCHLNSGSPERVMMRQGIHRGTVHGVRNPGRSSLRRVSRSHR